MTVAIPLPRIKLTPGSQLSIEGVSWEDFEGILIDLGDKRNSRLTYYHGKLEIMSPLAIHERPHRVIAYIITAILAAEGRDWEDFGSTTLKMPEAAGIEPDTCFYIKNADQVRNCTNLNLAKYPPPDLAIECDVTSTTMIDVYQLLAVPEVWVYKENQLTIYVFSDQRYQTTVDSPTFPGLPMTSLVPQLIQQAIQEGTSSMLRNLQVMLTKT
jgi:Uma2 family endonuclease